jgi:energy-converting hydrogenase Eha subunit G
MAADQNRATEDHHQETEQERLARNLSELLQELRVAQTGVQFLFGFLFSVAFTDHYQRISGLEQVVHLIAVLFATGAVALLTAPAAWHRMLFRQGRRPMIIDVANRLAIAGLGCLTVSMTATVLLLVSVVAGIILGFVVAGFTAAMFCLLWFVFPRVARGRDDENLLD